MRVASGLFSWSMVAGLLAFSSRQCALTINHGPLSASHYFSFLSKRGAKRLVLIIHAPCLVCAYICLSEMGTCLYTPGTWY